MKLRLFALLVLLHFAQSNYAKIVTYKAPQSDLNCSAYRIKVREAGFPWQNVDVYNANVADVIDSKSVIKKTSFGYFDCDGKVEIAVTVNSASIKNVRIRPQSLGIKPVINGQIIQFTVGPGQYISVEINGDIFQNLQIFANPVETSHPLATDTNVIYYGPGIHYIGRSVIPSDKTVYIAGGAIVQGSLIIDHAKNVRICGRGILTQLDIDHQSANVTNAIKSRQSRGDELTVDFSTDVQIDGITVLPHKYSMLIGQSDKVSVSNFKSFSSEGNADGIDVFCSSNIMLSHIFMRNSDDCIAIYGHRWNFYGNTHNVTVSNATLWADMAHPVLVGTHGDTDHPDTIENLKFKDIEVLDQHENQIDYQGCLALNAGDSNLIQKITFENVNIGDIRKGQIINLRVMFNHKYNTSPGRGIEDVLFKNLNYTGLNANLSIISGYDDKRGIKNIVFEDLRINGKVITDDMPGKPGFYKTGDMANIYVGEHVEGVRFAGQ